MIGTRWQLFRLRGIPINVDASWLLVVALLTWTLADHFQAAVPGWAVWHYWLMGLGTTLAFFVCIVLHELGHAVVAQGAGIPLRGITLFLFGGVAEIEGEPASAGSEFFMAVAGPAVSAVLAAVFAGLAAVGASLGWTVLAVIVLQTLAWINLSVLLFNLVPAFPLDGGRVLRSILWGALGNLKRATYWASLLGRGFAWLLMGLGVLQFVAGNPLDGIWLVLIGLFLSSAAQSGYQQVATRLALQGEPVRRFMNTEPIVVPPSLDLRQWVEDYVYRYHHKTYPVGENGRLEGVVSTDAVARYPRAEWDRHTVAEVMRQDLDAISLPPDADALQALEQMQRTGSSRLLVTEDGRLVGLLSLKDLLRFLELKLELEQGHDGMDSRGPASRRRSDRVRETAAHG